ncbi:hypothetical protein QTP88_022547 [Uroleucon formosanum]
MKTLGNPKKDENIYSKFKENKTSMINKITSIQNPEHLKVAMQKLEALDAFIDMTSKETATSTEFIKTNIYHLVNTQLIIQYCTMIIFYLITLEKLNRFF